MSLVSPSLLPYGITDSTDTLLFSSGMDRRVVLWTIPNTTTTTLNGLTPTDSRTRSASINLPTDLDGRVLLNAHESRFDSCNSSASRSYSDDVRLALIALLRLLLSLMFPLHLSVLVILSTLLLLLPVSTERYTLLHYSTSTCTDVTLSDKKFLPYYLIRLLLLEFKFSLLFNIYFYFFYYSY